MKVAAIIVAVALVGGGGVAAATYAGQVDWDAYFSDEHHYVDYKVNFMGQKYSVIHTDAGEGEDGLFYAVTKFEYYEEKGPLILLSSNLKSAEKIDNGYLFTTSNGSVYIPDVRAETGVVKIYKNVMQMTKELQEKYNTPDGHYFRTKHVDDHFELYCIPNGDHGFDDGYVVDSDYHCETMEMECTYYVISETNLIEVQHIEASKEDCNDKIYSAERFFNSVAENQALFAVLA